MSAIGDVEVGPGRTSRKTGRPWSCRAGGPPHRSLSMAMSPGARRWRRPRLNRHGIEPRCTACIAHAITLAWLSKMRRSSRAFLMLARRPCAEVPRPSLPQWSERCSGRRRADGIGRWASMCVLLKNRDQEISESIDCGAIAGMKESRGGVFSNHGGPSTTSRNQPCAVIEARRNGLAI